MPQAYTPTEQYQKKFTPRKTRTLLIFSNLLVCNRLIHLHRSKTRVQCSQKFSIFASQRQENLPTDKKIYFHPHRSKDIWPSIIGYFAKYYRMLCPSSYISVFASPRLQGLQSFYCKDSSPRLQGLRSSAARTVDKPKGLQGSAARCRLLSLQPCWFMKCLAKKNRPPLALSAYWTR